VPHCEGSTRCPESWSAVTSALGPTAPLPYYGAAALATIFRDSRPNAKGFDQPLE
jgi:hypothetical protein